MRNYIIKKLIEQKNYYNENDILYGKSSYIFHIIYDYFNVTVKVLENLDIDLTCNKNHTVISAKEAILPVNVEKYISEIRTNIMYFVKMCKNDYVTNLINNCRLPYYNIYCDVPIHITMLKHGDMNWHKYKN